ncbi:MAG TPA: hypothetical protein ENJ93_09000 [Chloroflexi bacterium]|nr:hypothetical protein [Chloroflexota bacterium]
MNGIFIPLALTFAALFAAFSAYRGIRRGGARFYTLEREAILKRASLSLAGATLLFLAAITLLVLQIRQGQTQAAIESGELVIEGEVTSTPLPEINTFPPTPSPTATIDTTIPTATATAVLCRAVVEGTDGNGLTLRVAPGGEELDILPEGSLVQLVSDVEPQEVNGLVWRNVRSIVTGNDGWVAEDFLALGPGCE